MRLVVVGAGIAGLAAAGEAVALAERAGIDLELSVLEAGERAGGKVFTETVGDRYFEWGPDSFLASKPAAAEMARGLGLELVEPSPRSRRAFVLRDGVLRTFPAGLAMGVHRGPASLAAAVRSGVVGPLGALRAAIEPILPGGVPDAPVAKVTRRRLGRAWSTGIVEPLVEGVYGARADALGMAAAFPAFAGASSLTAAARRIPRPREPVFLSVQGGLGRLIEGLVVGLPPGALLLRTGVRRIQREGSGLVLRTNGEDVPADGVVLAVPAPQAAALLSTEASGASATLETIRYSASAVFALRYERGALGIPLDGAGYLVPRREGLAHAACTWFSAKWPMAGEDGDLLRAIVTAPESLSMDDTSIAERVASEVGAIMHAIRAPADLRLHRWNQALPMYEPGHLERMARAASALPPDVALAGASAGGVGLSDCIESGRRAASLLLSNAKR
ncbi:MAG: NAD(P)/FAD-dependent oxidoreductase [Actinomycetota bacterium]